MSQKLGLVIGGSTPLGKAVINTFKSTWNLTNIDFKTNSDIEHNIILENDNFKPQLQSVYNKIKEFSNDNPYNAIIYLSQQPYKDSIQQDNVIENYKQAQQNITQSALLAAHLSTKYLDQNGLLLLQGSQRQTKLPMVDSLSYTIAVSSIPTIVSNTSAHPTMQNKTAIALLPEDIDTEQNRMNDPSGDYSKWIKPDSIAGLIKMWAEGLNLPESGSYAILENNKQKLANPSYVEEY